MDELVRRAAIPEKVRSVLKMQHWDAERRAEWVAARVSEQLAAAAATEYGRAARIDPAAGLAAVEPLERAALRDAFDELRGPSDGVLSHRATSGSTGRPVRMVHGPETVGWAAAGRLRQLVWFGLEPRDHAQVNVRIAARADDPLLRREERDPPLFWLNPYGLDAASADAAHDELVGAGGVALLGAESSLLERWAHAAAAGERDPRALGVRLAVCGGEMTYDHQKHAAAETFGCAVAALYGSHECSIIAAECPAGSLHVCEEAALVEVLAPDGEPGEVLVTLLHNHELPLLRYRLGDVGAWVDGPCPCGVTCRRLRLDLGRLEEMVLTPAGTLLHPRFLRSIYERHIGDNLRAFHTVQLEPDLFEARLELDAVAPDGLGDDLAAEVGAYVGTRVRVRVVEAVAAPPPGKLRTFTRAF